MAKPITYRCVYPRDFMLKHRFSWSWNEQYILQAMLQGSDQFEVIWPGHYLDHYFQFYGKLE